MEGLFDSLENSSKTNNETNFEGWTYTEPTVSNDEATFERLICQLTDKLPDTVPSHDTQERGIKLQDPQNVDEILGTDETLIAPTCHNVSVINSACQNVLKQMEHQLLTLLKKNRKEQEMIQNFLGANCKDSFFETTKRPSLKCAGMPYFKDFYGFQQPPNEDVLRKQKNKKLLPVDFIKTYPVWNSTDSKKLKQAVQQYPVSKPSSIDWMKISVTDMEGKYSPSECKAKWMMHLNPSINKSSWNLKEMTLLKELSSKHNYQDWDKIAEELNTNRNGLQCCIQYHTHTATTEGKWTKQEDEALKKLVEKYKIKDYIPWKKVAWYFEDRSLKQCQERYAYHLGNIKKGNFTMEEDFVIVYLASKLKNFGAVAKYIPNRVSTQVRARYEYLVELSMPKFSKEEDQLLTQLMIKYPRNWKRISENFKNRSRVQCRRRWASLQRNIQLEINSDLENDYEDSIQETDSIGNVKSKIDDKNMKKNILLISKPSESIKKYPEVYNRLLNYHKYCHKFLFGPKPRVSYSSEDLKALTQKISVTMKTLSVNYAAPLHGFDLETLSNNDEFDKEDIAILNDLSSSVKEDVIEGFELSRKIVPPNYMTLVGLRTFTLGWSAIQNLTALHTEQPQQPTQIDPNDRILFSDAKKLFKSRLKSIFAFPVLLSNISTTVKPTPAFKSKVRKSVKPLSKRKRKVHAKLMSAAYRNKLAGIIEKFENPNNVFEETGLFEAKSNGKKKSNHVSKGGQSGASVSGEENCIASGSKLGRKREFPIQPEINECELPLKKRTTRNSHKPR